MSGWQGLPEPIDETGGAPEDGDEPSSGAARRPGRSRAPSPRRGASDAPDLASDRSDPGAPAPAGSNVFPWDETPRVLEEIARIHSELRPRRPTSGAPPEPAPEPSAGTAEGREPAPFEGATTSPYLEERLELARTSMTGLGRELRELEDRWQALRAAAEVLEQELGNATLEAEFLRNAGRTTGRPTVSAARAPATASRPSAGAPSASPAADGAPFVTFTADRYNRTIGDLKARRRRLAWGTVVIAAAISAVLVTLAVAAHEPMPPLWLALLPAVWMIPVPFFLVSFLSTQRVLRRDHLDLPGDP